MFGTNRIHPTAIISDTVQLGDNVVIGPYTIIEDEVIIGDNNKIGSHCHFKGWTKIGDNNFIRDNVTIGFPPQNIEYDGKKTYVIIGDNNCICEYVTIHRGTKKGREETKIGDNNFFNIYSHIAHDCNLGNNITLENYVNLAGHVTVYNDAFIEKMVGVHQFVKIGSLSRIKAHSKLIKDLPPYIVVNGHPAQVIGINEVGLNKKEIKEEIKEEIRNCYNILYHSKLSFSQAIKKLEKETQNYNEIKVFIKFLKKSNRGICR